MLSGAAGSPAGGRMLGAWWCGSRAGGGIGIRPEGGKGSQVKSGWGSSYVSFLDGPPYGIGGSFLNPQELIGGGGVLESWGWPRG